MLFHSADAGDVCRNAREYPPGPYGVWFLGTFPDNVVIGITDYQSRAIEAEEPRLTPSVRDA